MTKIILSFPVRCTAPLSCVWFETGNPARPLACRWIASGDAAAGPRSESASNQQIGRIFA